MGGIWADNPEWFDEWIEEQALDGRFGEEIRIKIDNGEIEPYDLWGLLDKDGKLGGEAEADYYSGAIDRAMDMMEDR